SNEPRRIRTCLEIGRCFLWRQPLLGNVRAEFAPRRSLRRRTFTMSGRPSPVRFRYSLAYRRRYNLELYSRYLTNMCGFLTILQDIPFIDVCSARHGLEALSHRGPDAVGDWSED